MRSECAIVFPFSGQFLLSSAPVRPPSALRARSSSTSPWKANFAQFTNSMGVRNDPSSKLWSVESVCAWSIAPFVFCINMFNQTVVCVLWFFFPQFSSLYFRFCFSMSFFIVLCSDLLSYARFGVHCFLGCRDTLYLKKEKMFFFMLHIWQCFQFTYARDQWSPKSGTGACSSQLERHTVHTETNSVINACFKDVLGSTIGCVFVYRSRLIKHQVFLLMFRLMR